MPRKVDGCHIYIPKHGALSAVDTRVTNFPAGGGSFRIRPGHQRFIELGTARATRLASLGKLVVGALTHCRLAPILPCPHSSRG